jgi:hypothetical protein
VSSSWSPLPKSERFLRAHVEEIKLLISAFISSRRRNERRTKGATESHGILLRKHFRYLRSRAWLFGSCLRTICIIGENNHILLERPQLYYLTRPASHYDFENRKFFNEAFRFDRHGFRMRARKIRKRTNFSASAKTTGNACAESSVRKTVKKRSQDGSWDNKTTAPTGRQLKAATLRETVMLVVLGVSAYNWQTVQQHSCRLCSSRINMPARKHNGRSALLTTSDPVGAGSKRALFRPTCANPPPSWSAVNVARRFQDGATSVYKMQRGAAMPKPLWF